MKAEARDPGLVSGAHGAVPRDQSRRRVCLTRAGGGPLPEGAEACEQQSTHDADAQ